MMFFVHRLPQSENYRITLSWAFSKTCFRRQDAAAAAAATAALAPQEQQQQHLLRKSPATLRRR
jgi:hypothetical protein